MALFLGLAAALTYGAADFLGGHVSRRTSVFGVVLISQLVGSALFFAVVPFVSEADPTRGAFIWGAMSGLAGGSGVLLFYRALAIGRMSVIAPITGVLAASVPVVWGLASGERPAALAMLGVVLALAAVWFVSAGPEPGPDSPAEGRFPPGLVLGLGAGVAFGAFFVFLAEAGDDTGMWPLVAGRLASMVLVGTAIIVGRRPVRPAPGTMAGIIGAGVFDVTANVLYLLATRQGLLSLVAVLTSMYPASTVLLARVVLKERLVRLQVIGLAIAGVGVTLIGLG